MTNTDSFNHNPSNRVDPSSIGSFDEKRQELEKHPEAGGLGFVTTDLNIHHITPYEDFNDYKQANQLQNLITLCTSCHSLVEWGTIELQTRLDNH